MLTDRESEVLDIIVEYINKNGYAPSVREIGEIVGLKSSSTTHKYLKKLEAKGYIERNYFGADKISIHITENGTDRESTSFQKVISKCSNVLEGEFESTAGDSKGICIWQRKPF